MKKKIVSLVLVFAMALALGIGGTIAWLTDKTETVTNTFTVGNIDIDLIETLGGENKEFKMVPGSDIAKDPKVSVTADSESCYLFVKIEKANDFDKYMTFDVADVWTALDGQPGVYYRVVNHEDSVREFSVLAGDKVTVLDTVTKTDMDNLTEATYPKLSFTAYAVQKENMADVNAAWTAATSSAT